MNNEIENTIRDFVTYSEFTHFSVKENELDSDEIILEHATFPRGTFLTFPKKIVPNEHRHLLIDVYKMIVWHMSEKSFYSFYNKDQKLLLKHDATEKKIYAARV